MNLEIGMYVRTINGKIWIIKSQKAISGHRKDIINASYNLIDLIEVGDYVNGECVSCITPNHYIEIGYGEELVGLHNKDIKTIVTKEQFESIKYEVE